MSECRALTNLIGKAWHRRHQRWGRRAPHRDKSMPPMAHTVDMGEALEREGSDGSGHDPRVRLSFVRRSLMSKPTDSARHRGDEDPAHEQDTAFTFGRERGQSAWRPCCRRSWRLWNAKSPLLHA